jgi:hypothetical protein
VREQRSDREQLLSRVASLLGASLCGEQVHAGAKEVSIGVTFGQARDRNCRELQDHRLGCICQHADDAFNRGLIGCGWQLRKGTADRLPEQLLAGPQAKLRLVRALGQHLAVQPAAEERVGLFLQVRTEVGHLVGEAGAVCEQPFDQDGLALGIRSSRPSAADDRLHRLHRAGTANE